MTDADVQTAHDLKAGRSSFCRAENHRTCHDLQARCMCTCHGRGGQQPPTPTPPPIKEHPTVSEATVTTLPTPTTAGEHRCPECGRNFERSQALGRHRSAAHGVQGKTKRINRSKPAKAAPPPHRQARPTRCRAAQEDR